MKTLLTITLTAVAFSAITALADDQSLQNRLALDRSVKEQSPTIALYANKQGMGRAIAREEVSSPVFETRMNAHGEMFAAHADLK